jgi:hypothetical protein
MTRLQLRRRRALMSPVCPAVLSPRFSFLALQKRIIEVVTRKPRTAKVAEIFSVEVQYVELL